ncbi:helix-turn-helix transcriptional regulator, partial [Escherichia coli]|nr:helix-turn-helix transcriptional regulator [Escherichia coli]
KTDFYLYIFICKILNKAPINHIEITGFGFSNYIATRKITIAKSLLRFSDLQVNTIALELAYQDSNYFCRIFKKDTGMTPSDYRKVVSPGITR